MICHKCTDTLEFSFCLCDQSNKCTLFILLSWSLELTGIREIMELPSCSSNSHPAPPLLCLRVLPSIDQPISTAGISQQLITTAHFPKDTTHSRIHDPGFLAYIPTVHSGSLHSPSLKLQRKRVCQGRQLLPRQKQTKKTYRIQINRREGLFVLE